MPVHFDSIADSLIDLAVKRWQSQQLPAGSSPSQLLTPHEVAATTGFFGQTPAHVGDFHNAAAVLAGSKGVAVVSPDFFGALPVTRRLAARLLAKGHKLRPVAGGVAVIKSPVKYARENEQAHRLVAGYRLEQALRSLIDDPKASSNTRLLAQTALFPKATADLDEGDLVTGALLRLHDSLAEDDHPLATEYNWQAAAHKVLHDDATGAAIDAVVQHLPERADVTTSPRQRTGLLLEAVNRYYPRRFTSASSGPAADDAAYEAVHELRQHLTPEEMNESLLRHWTREADSTSPEYAKVAAFHPRSEMSIPLSTATRYARRTVRKPVHDLVKGTRLAITLKLLARSQKSGGDVNALAKNVLRDGDTTSLAILADKLEENNHPLAGAYDWRSAAKKLHLDSAVHGALYDNIHHLYRAAPHLLEDQGLMGAAFNTEAESLLDHHLTPGSSGPPVFPPSLVRVHEAAREFDPEVTHADIAGSLRRAALKGADQLATSKGPPQDTPYGQMPAFSPARQQFLQQRLTSAINREPVPTNSFYSNITKIETPPTLAASRFRFSRGTELTSTFNSEFSKLADRLHATHGVSDLDKVKSTDLYGSLLHAAKGNEELAMDTATQMIYGGQLEKRHRPGTPLLPLIRHTAKLAPAVDRQRQLRQLGGGLFSDLATEDYNPATATGEDRSLFKTTAKIVNPVAKANKERIQRIRQLTASEHGKKLLSYIQKYPRGVSITELSRNLMLLNPQLLAAAAEVGIPVKAYRTRTNPRTLLFPPGVEPPVDTKEEKYQQILKSVTGGKSYKDAAVEHGVSLNQVRNVIEKLRKRPKTNYSRSESASADFVSALRRVKSQSQEALREVAAAIHKKLKLEPATIADAIYDHPRGAIANTAQSLYHTDPQSARLAAAWYGLQSQSPSLLVFHAGEGKDSLYRLRLSGSGERIRNKLDAHGLSQRVLIPTRTGFDVLLYSPGGTINERAERFATATGAGLKRTTGNGEVIGGSEEPVADEHARRSYRSIIREHERREQIANGQQQLPQQPQPGNAVLTGGLATAPQGGPQRTL